uniref:Uncharacterized protein n=1 Tax=Lutzomyia longipalpis TaxID=7200 RepID=A0A1B0CVE5_LUTLO
MPSQRHKVSGKSNVKQEVEKIKIKAEPIDILPLSEYVDDRVELIKQAFSCLKPKSIKAIAPDFLQNKPIEKIQEQCLNEVLGMSKKRLLSIINATKCPTDTESSSDEEGVERIEAHISLDEISSEDDRPKAKKKTQKNAEKKEAKGSKEKKAEADAGAKPGEVKKEYSVLELLELQARARAIRSQLALEPVTKIEIKESDEEDEIEEQPPQIKPPAPPVQPSIPQPAPVPEKSSESSRLPSTTKPSSSGRTVRIVKSTVAESSNKVRESSRNGVEKDKPVKSNEGSQSTERRIKLKRNWRKKSADGEAGKDNPANFVIEIKNTAVEKVVEERRKVSVDERSPSPDVLPIIPSPETLCISSDTDEEAPNAKEKPGGSPAKKAREETIAPPKEVTPPKEAPVEASKDETLEEGEVLDELEINIQEDEKNLEAVIAEDSKKVQEKDTEKVVEESEKQSAGEKDAENEEVEKEKQTTEKDKQTTDDEKSDDDLNDDCIEIVCTDILDEQQDNTDHKEESDNQNKTEAEEEILDLNDSSDEDNLPLSQLVGEKKSPPKSRNSKIESWNSRWLESSRVSKIMATSRLGNSVRRKIKTKTMRQKEVEENDSNSGGESQQQVRVLESNMEEGSVGQYRELAEKQQ